MEIIGNSFEKRGTYEHEREGVFVNINLMFTCHFTRIDCEVGLVTLRIWTSISGSKRENNKLSLDSLILNLNSSIQ